MATLTITSLAKKDITAVSEEGTLGEAAVAGDALYFNLADQKWYKMDCNPAGSAAQSGASGAGWAMSTGQIDEVIEIARDGEYIVDTTVTAGKTYVAGGTVTGAAGDIVDNADADTDKLRKTVLFVAKGASGSNTIVIFRPIVSETGAP